MPRHTLPSCLLLALLGLGLAPAPARADDDAPVVVVTTLPYLADLARAVGGARVEATALCAAGQDPHFMVPTPQLGVTVAHADVFIETGLQLELWSERVIDSARNAGIRPGAPGHVYAGTGLKPLQVPAAQTRAAGDVHVGGNPHVWLDPLNLAHIAANIEACLARVRPAWTAEFAAGREAFVRRLDEAYFGPELVRILGAASLRRLHATGRLRAFLRERQFQGKPLEAVAGGWLRRAIDLGPLAFVSYHQVWTYFAESFGLRCAGTIEEKPGIPPSPGHLEQLEGAARAAGVRVVWCAPFYPFGNAQGLAERLGLPAIVLPTQPGEEGTTELLGMFDLIFDRIEEAVRRPRGEAPR